MGLASEAIKAHKDGKAAEKESLSGSTSEPSNRQVDDYQSPAGPPPSYQQGQDSKAGPAQYPDEKSGGTQQQGDVVGMEEASLEDEWNLDETQDEAYYNSSEKAPVYDSIFAPSSSEALPAETAALEDTFIPTHPIPRELQINPTRIGKLPLTVVLPQRRPKDGSRGFIRAYASVLENCGIDQAT